MDTGTELIDALAQVAREKGIEKELIFEAIEASLVSACKKHFGASANIKVTVNHDNGQVVVLAQKLVVENVTDENQEISLTEAQKINHRYELGDTADIVVTPRNFGRISAQTAKQVVVQKFREAEREILYKEYMGKERDIVTGIVQRRDRRNVVVGLGKLDAVMQPSEQTPREEYTFQDRIKVYVLEVKQTNKGPLVNVSRTHPELVKRLFEQEVPEVFDGVVEIKSVAREPGQRSKLAVYSKNPNVDPVGACVGQSGYRVNIISGELRGEKLDIIQWSSDPAKYIAAALSPSKVVTVVTNPEDMTARVVVPDHQLSLAIGKEGQNARLAARLTGWRIDIKSESQARDTDFLKPIIKEATPESEPVFDEANETYEEAYAEAYDDGYDDEYDDGYDDYDDYDDGYDDGYDDEYDDGYDDEYDDGYDDGYDDDGYDEYDSDYDDEAGVTGATSATGQHEEAVETGLADNAQGARGKKK